MFILSEFLKHPHMPQNRHSSMRNIEKEYKIFSGKFYSMYNLNNCRYSNVFNVQKSYAE